MQPYQILPSPFCEPFIFYKIITKSCEKYFDRRADGVLETDEGRNCNISSRVLVNSTLINFENNVSKLNGDEITR